MAQRSSRKRRKERQRSRAEAASAGAAEVDITQSAEAPTAAGGDTDADRMARGYARGRIKDAEARAKLVPLAKGERPTPVTVAAVVATVLAVANVIALAVRYDPDKSAQSVYTLLVCGLLAAMAWGMWKVRYWAVLGMQALLGITVLFAALAMIRANNWWGFALTLAIVVAGGTLFWFLIKSMARIQMPTPPGAR